MVSERAITPISMLVGRAKVVTIQPPLSPSQKMLHVISGVAARMEITYEDQLTIPTYYYWPLFGGKGK